MMAVMNDFRAYKQDMEGTGYLFGLLIVSLTTYKIIICLFKS